MLLDTDCCISIFTFMFHFKEAKLGNRRRCHQGWLKPEERGEDHLTHICNFKVKIKSLMKMNTFFMIPFFNQIFLINLIKWVQKLL